MLRLIFFVTCMPVLRKKIMTVIFNFTEDLFLHFFEVLTIKSFTISVRDYLFYSCDLNV